MSPSVTLTALCCLLAALSAHSQEPQYRKLGDSVTLSPDLSSVTGPITNIVWKHGPDLAMEWDGRETDAYRHFKDRGNLNNSAGALSISGLMTNDSGVYTGEINGKVTSEIHLKVIAPVPKPSVSVSCDADVTSCVLSCDGDTTDADPFTYSWSKGNNNVTNAQSKELTVTKERDVGFTQISCMLENPVSQENSKPINNPFITAPVEPAGELKVKTGLIVFISLVAIVLVSVFVHRWKAGVWFYEKDVLPCQADFWKKQEETNQVNDTADMERPSAKDKKKARFKSGGKKDNGEAAESNGTGAAEAGQPEENRLMTEDGKPATPDQEH